MVEEYFTAENYGVDIEALRFKSDSREDQRVKKILADTTKIENGRYATGLLWKEPAK